MGTPPGNKITVSGDNSAGLVRGSDNMLTIRSEGCAAVISADGPDLAC